ncbi:hypothetical protein B0O99DRAFT_92884 [Bisporella sp. PMI_857]|nr:hypothetical protein B0O99DRAFT_92884 [Bisporella sp. PMI_857]
MNSTLSTQLALFRVQHKRSFTYYEPNVGFKTNGFYWMDYSHWFNPSKVRKNDKSSELSPFISLFDNLADTQKRASFLRKRRERNMFIAQIVPTSEFNLYCLPIQFLNSRININSWIHSETKTLFFPTQKIESKFSINYSIIQRSEWLALFSIPTEIITQIIV